MRFLLLIYSSLEFAVQPGMHLYQGNTNLIVLFGVKVVLIATLSGPGFLNILLAMKTVVRDMFK